MRLLGGTSSGMFDPLVGRPLPAVPSLPRPVAWVLRPTGRTVALALAYALAVVAGRHVHIASLPLALAWPAAGVVTVWFLVCASRREALAATGLILLITGPLNLATGVEPVTAWAFGLVNVLNGVVAAAVLRWGGWTGPRAVRTFSDVRLLALASAVAGLLTALLGGSLAAARHETTLLEAVGMLGLRNGVSTFVVSAALLALRPASRPGARATVTVPLIVLSVVVAAAVMVVPLPLAFMMVAPLTVVALRCGPEATSVAVALQGVVIVVATAAGRGQFALVEQPLMSLVLAQILLVLLAGGALIVAIVALDRAEALAASRYDRDRLINHMEAALVAAAHVVVDADGGALVTSVNDAMTTLTARQGVELVGTDPSTWLDGDDAACLAEGALALATHGSGGWRRALRMAPTHGSAWVDVASALVSREEGGRVLIKLQFIDVTAQLAAEQDLAHAALHDDLTGLANRVLWADRLDRAIAVERGPEEYLAVLYVDVDHFKQINDAYGHDVGDEVLREVAHRLAALVRPQDTVARMGGDEFVILCPRVPRVFDGRCRLSERIQLALRAPVLVGSHAVTVTVSVGVGIAEARDTEGRLLLRRADAALYAAKAAGRARSEIYRAEAHRGDERDAALLVDLEQGQRAGEFVVHYQPIVDAVTGRPVAAEALLRWQHPVRGLLAPGAFLDVLEGSDLMHPVGAAVLERACADGARLLRAGCELDIHVNVSAAELERPGLADRVVGALTRTGLPPRLLVIEVTETRLVSITRALLDELGVLCAQGVRLAVDDFGTGYSTLTHLVELPVGVVKLDRSFVADIAGSSSAGSIASGVCAIAEGLGVEAVAEGVENEEQAAVLRAMGYQRLQGYHCARPAPIEDLLRHAAVPA